MTYYQTIKAINLLRHVDTGLTVWMPEQPDEQFVGHRLDDPLGGHSGCRYLVGMGNEGVRHQQTTWALPADQGLVSMQR
jgi:hypothetical protein